MLTEPRKIHLKFRRQFTWHEKRNHVLRVSPHGDGQLEMRHPGGALSCGEEGSQEASDKEVSPLQRGSTTLFFRLRNLMTHGKKVSF